MKCDYGEEGILHATTPDLSMNIRYLGDNFVEIFNTSGTFEILKIQQPTIPYISSRHSLVQDDLLLNLGKRESITCTDFLGSSPFSILATSEGRLFVQKVELDYEVPFSTWRNVWKTPNETPVRFCRLNNIDQALVSVGFTDGSSHHISVLDMVSERGMTSPSQRLQRSSLEQFYDSAWLRTDPSLLLLSSCTALRLLDIRDPADTPPSLFHAGPARLLTVNTFRTNLVAAVVGFQIQVFDCRKLYGPVAVYDPGREFNSCTINMLKWHSRDPNELLFSSTSSATIGKVNTSAINDCFTSRNESVFNYDDVVCMEKIWDKYVSDEFVEKRMKRYLNSTDVVHLPSYGEQFDLCRCDPTCHPEPLILNCSTSKMEKGAPELPELLLTPLEDAKLQPRASGCNQFLCLPQLEKTEKAVCAISKIVTAVGNYIKSDTGNTIEKDQLKDFEALLTRLSFDKDLRFSSEELEQNLEAFGFDEELISWMINLFCDGSTTHFSESLLSVDVSDGQIAIKAVEEQLTMYCESFDNEKEIVAGRDYGCAYLFDTNVNSFCLPPVGCCGVLVYMTNGKIEFVPSSKSDQERVVDNSLWEKFYTTVLRETYDVTPPEVWQLIDERVQNGLCRDCRRFGRINMIGGLTNVDPSSDKASPWWFVWMKGSVDFYEGPIDNETVDTIVDECNMDSSVLTSKEETSDNLNDSLSSHSVGQETDDDCCSHENLANTSFMTEDLLSDNEDSSSVRGKLDYFVTKSTCKQRLWNDFTGLDVKVKGFPGFLQLSKLEMESESESIVSADVVFFDKIKMYMSFYRHRILIPFALTYDDITRDMVEYEFCEDMADYYDLLYCALLHGKFCLFFDVAHEMITRFGEAERRNLVDFYPVQYLGKFVEILGSLIEISRFRDSELLESHDARMDWLEQVDEFISKQLGKEGADPHLLPIIRVLRCVVSGQNPQDFTDAIVLDERIPLSHRILWLTTMCDAKTLHTNALYLASKSEGLDRLMYYGLGRHTDSLSILADFVTATHDWQLTSHLVIAARVLEDDWAIFDKLRHVSGISIKKCVRPGTLPKRTKTDRKRRFSPFFGFHSKYFKSGALSRSQLGSARRVYRLCRYLGKHGRISPAFHMHEVFPNTFLSNRVPLEQLLSLCQMVVVRYLNILGAQDHCFYRQHLLRLIGSNAFRRRHVELVRFEMQCTFCGFTRSKSTKPRRTFDPELEKKRQVIKERSDRRRMKFSVARQERVDRGEPASYVPAEDINGSLAASEQEIKWPPPTACPQCRRPYSKCMICHKIDRTPSQVKHSSGYISNHFTICKICHHGGHVHHVVDWFRREEYCAVNGCNCKCARNPPIELNREWSEDSVCFKQKKTSW